MTQDLKLQHRLTEESDGKTLTETTAAHQAYLDYREMGITRSLRKLHEVYQAADKAPTTRLATLESWSSRWQWQDRIKEYRQVEQQKRQEEEEKLRILARQQRRAVLQRVENILVAQLDVIERHPQSAEEPDQILDTKVLNATMRAFSTYMEQSRRENNDLPTERTDLTSGGQEIHVSFNTEVIPQSAVNERLQRLGLGDYVTDHTDEQ